VASPVVRGALQGMASRLSPRRRRCSRDRRQCARRRDQSLDGQTAGGARNSGRTRPGGEDLRALLTIRQEVTPFYTACWIRTVRRSGVADDGRRRSGGERDTGLVTRPRPGRPHRPSACVRHHSRSQPRAERTAHRDQLQESSQAGGAPGRSRPTSELSQLHDRALMGALKNSAS